MGMGFRFQLDCPWRIGGAGSKGNSLLLLERLLFCFKHLCYNSWCDFKSKVLPDCLKSQSHTLPSCLRYLYQNSFQLFSIGTSAIRKRLQAQQLCGRRNTSPSSADGEESTPLGCRGRGCCEDKGRPGMMSNRMQTGSGVPQLETSAPGRAAELGTGARLHLPLEETRKYYMAGVEEPVSI